MAAARESRETQAIMSPTFSEEDNTKIAGMQEQY